MGFEALLTAECTLQEETFTLNDKGEEIRGFGSETTVKCRLNPVSGAVGDDLQIGQIGEINRFVLFLAPDTTISTETKVTVDGLEMKVDRVREFHDGSGVLHHYECDLQEVT